MSVHKFIPKSRTELQTLLHPAQASLGYCVASIQSLQLLSTQCPLSLVPLTPKSQVPFKVCTQL